MLDLPVSAADVPTGAIWLAQAGIMKRPEQARQRSPRPHHHRTFREVATMADANSIRPAGRSSNGTPLYESACPDCGNVRLGDKRKIDKRCQGCAIKRRCGTHGLSNHWLYRVWAGAKARCTIQSVSHFEYYGGRGIAMCAEWIDSPETFISWAKINGARRGLELDRIDTNGNYAPGNCSFVTHASNSRNRRNGRITEAHASLVKADLRLGLSVNEVSKNRSIPYMSVWHIAKGNTWRDVK